MGGAGARRVHLTSEFSSRPSRLSFLLVTMALAAFLASTIRAADYVREASAYKDWSVSSVTVRGLDNKTASALEKGLALGL